ncbi:MAG: hypothetical protein E7I63_03485 [Citrobacter koseri]|uniref:hypothetical protein n=1 Tax=Citrobacter koseri TaxID=545 RepID=UPI001A30F5F4|nr:hypothetical protein [Citrobacter koseri]MDT7496148.1 hypothetical protein [Citrobacter koseri]MDU4399825.1 hypothetical protein [Citrobacter koseri]CAG0277892.1 hypothetical protein AN2351V1_3283 [Citrobacter koseri]CAH6130469.1 hypothetical protein AN2351V1_3283 [Citrobacter koseri]HAT7526047.1 hypothetical protein [Citrobacter koseri]
MKWQHAKKVNLVILLSISVLLAIAFGTSPLTGGAERPNTDVEGTFQLGFYDLMSQTKEIYNSRMKTTKGTILATITSPDDNRFVLKEKFTPTSGKNGKLYFYLTPIYYTTTHKGLMIDGLVDMLMNTNFWMEPLAFNGQPLVVGQSGSIFLYPIQQ